MSDRPRADGRRRERDELDDEHDRAAREILRDLDDRDEVRRRQIDMLRAWVDQWIEHPDRIHLWSDQRLSQAIGWLRESNLPRDSRMQAFLGAVTVERRRREESPPPGAYMNPCPLNEMSNEAIREELSRLRTSRAPGVDDRLAALTREVHRRTGVSVGPEMESAEAPDRPVGNDPPRPFDLRARVLVRAADIREQRRRADEARRARVLASWQAFCKTYNRVRRELRTLVGLRVICPHGALHLIADELDPNTPSETENSYFPLRLVSVPSESPVGSGINVCCLQMQWYSGNPPTTYEQKPWKYNTEPASMSEAQVLDMVAGAIADDLADGPHGNPENPEDRSATRKGIDL